jgi:hypothetical protein
VRLPLNFGAADRSFKEKTMATLTVDGVVEGGMVRLPDDLRLPDHTKVRVIVIDELVEEEVIQLPPLPPVIHLRTPRIEISKDAMSLEKTLVPE